MTSQGTAHGRFTRAIQQRNLWAADASLRELGQPSLDAALAYLDLLAEQKPEKLERACVRWHGRLETEATFLTLAESQPALAALASLCAGERSEAVRDRHGMILPQAAQGSFRNTGPRAGGWVVRLEGRSLGGGCKRLDLQACPLDHLRKQIR